MTLEKTVLNGANGGRAEIYRHGAHVVSWLDSSGDERLFLSGLSEFRPGAAIRGGIPVIFPQFSTLGPLPKHGFARTSEWERLSPEIYRLSDTAATRAIWPHPFTAELRVRVGGDTLDVRLSVHNTGQEEFSFTAALHTYVRVNDVAEVRVHGLARSRYRDTASGGVQRVQRHGQLSVVGEVDRVYLQVDGPVEVHEAGRVTRSTMTGFRDVVIWNPGPSATLADMDPGGFQRMVCVEAAMIGAPVRLVASEGWTGSQTLTTRATNGS